MSFCVLLRAESLAHIRRGNVMSEARSLLLLLSLFLPPPRAYVSPIFLYVVFSIYQSPFFYITWSVSALSSTLSFRIQFTSLVLPPLNYCAFLIKSSSLKPSATRNTCGWQWLLSF
uniref:Uncharacterized protein n=1 Tax=Trypanosoma congolense (strain IL3000) TaxID=1068625 RepID=G0UPM3_TRYCI|nr:hypothetical protein, unlikely [Trypanosoma congolense IL3000]